MENLVFDLDKFKTPIDKANAIMTFIANRAAGFNQMNYKRIYVEIDDTKRGCVMYNLIFVLAPYIHLPFITRRAADKAQFWKNNNLIKRKFFIDKLIKKEDTLCWGKTGIDILSGISEEYVSLIAKELYGWVETC